MKLSGTYIFICALLLLSIEAGAWQLTVERNLPRSGDKLDLIPYENVAPVHGGDNVLWDFSLSNVSAQSLTLSYTGSRDELITARILDNRGRPVKTLLPAGSTQAGEKNGLG